MAVVNCRVENRVRPNASKEEKEKAFKGMLAAFKRKVNESEILVRYKEKQFYESKSEKKRKKRKEIERLRSTGMNSKKYRDYFGN